MNDAVLLKQKLLEMAKVFHKFCQENDIKYYMLGGTMLGAIRHKGFIPWDDDIDFGVPRKDYDRMLTLRDKLPDGYTFNVPSDGKHFKYGFCKMYDENTTYVESGLDTLFVGGVFIDVFPLDEIGDDLQKANKLSKKIHSKKRIISSIYQKGGRTTFLKSVAARCLQILPESPKWFDMPYNVIKKFKGKSSLYWINVYGAAQPLPAKCFGEPKLYDFEDTQFYGVEDYDTYLKLSFGDYMQLPPEEERKGHSICYVDYNNPYKKFDKTNFNKDSLKKE